MNGECESYRLNNPLKWHEFRRMPKDLQIDYIKAIREKYNAPNNAIAKMLGVNHETFWRLSKELELPQVNRGPKKWDKMGFVEWCNGKENGVTAEDEPESVEEEIPACPYLVKAVPATGSMTFEDTVENILPAIHKLLDNKKVCMHVEWTVVEE